MENLTFKKDERLNSKILIGKLFSEGDSFLAYPLKVVLLKTDFIESFPAQVSFSVSKRNFKKAVTRNLIKRRMRETYRLQKSSFYQKLESENIKLVMMFVFIGKEISSYQEIEKGMKSALKKTLSKILTVEN